MQTPQPTLSQVAIRRWIGEESLRRGESYFRDGMIFNARRAGAQLKAECHGSRGNAYRVQATIADGAVAEARCSCPVGGGGHCKHVAALLLNWSSQPDDFRAVEETDTALEKRSKEELVALIRQMLLRVPELESLLEVPLPTGKKKASQKVSAETYRRQASAAFRGSDYEWGAEEGIAEQVSATVAIGDGFLEQGEVENAATVYEAVASEVLGQYEEIQDESGALGGVVQDCVAGLGKCLEDQSTDTARREQILSALFEVYRFDVEFGGVGLGDDVPDLILKHANAAEKKQVVEWTRAALKKRAGDSWSDNYHRQVYGRFMLDLQADTLDDEAYLRLCRETNRLDDLVARLLELKRVDEAVKEASRAGDYELLSLAGIFAQHQQGEIAERLMTERAQTTKDSRIFEWLRERRKKKGDAAGALVWARKIFDGQPSLEEYREVKQLATPPGTWQTMRAEILADALKQKDFDLLTEIHLDDGEIDAALEMVERAPEDTLFHYFSPHLRLQVAAAAEENRPREALRLYLQAAEHIIRARNRNAYTEACQHLVRVRALYQKLGESAAWDAYLQKLKEETKAMRAFKEEMVKAKL